ncbi:sigma-70 family RNA polymerase sigma factor [Puteibacter caeruleilacunae]|nr:sigma-70 family RNA polymerase sigma factor [Puteibacter caeruleilacunae]
MSRKGNYLGEEEMWKLFKQGDKQAFAMLYSLHVDAVYRYGTKICEDEDTVKDCIQDLFFELYQKRNSIKIGPNHIKFYLFLALKRELIRQLNAQRKKALLPEEDGFFQTEYSIEHRLIHDEEKALRNRRIKALIKRLPAKQREIMYLRFNESMEYDEIAEITSISIESARKQVYRAVKTVREMFRKEIAVGFTLMLRKAVEDKLSMFKV